MELITDEIILNRISDDSYLSDYQKIFAEILELVDNILQLRDDLDKDHTELIDFLSKKIVYLTYLFHCFCNENSKFEFNIFDYDTLNKVWIK